MRTRLLSAFVFSAAAATIALAATSDDARYSAPLSWKKPHISRVFALGYTDLGVNGRGASEVKTIDGQSCVVGPTVGFDVEDGYAFDVDEPIDLTLTYLPAQTTAQTLTVMFDRNAGDGRGTVDVTPERTGATGRATVRLERARFAGQGAQGTDFAVAARQGSMALCDITVTRSGSTKPSATLGTLRLSVTDGVTGRTAAARVGLYDGTGRLPLPSDQAIPINRFTDPLRRVWMNRRTAWPVESHEAFYVNGNYEARAPAGVYDLVVARGPEYRIHHQKITIRAGETSTVGVSMRRFDDLPTRGWYSGESHLHLKRERVADANVWTAVSAEDLHIAHLLEMGNIMGTYFKQPAWGTRGRYEKEGVALVSGQEDPRTVMRGHTIHWNVANHAHFNAEGFFQYHLVFERTRREGALTGYAHLGELFNGRRGLAIDVPFGLVDFIEVLQGGRINTEIWYSFLNLGFKILPVAGADWPYFGPTLPGVERTFVKVDGPFTVDSWLDGFRKGHAYVTNGPFLEFSVNGHQMGEELRVPKGTKLEISASAGLNPDVDTLDRLEIVEFGDVRAKESAGGKDRVRLETTLTADHSMWIAARAYGSHQENQFTTVAHSAPIYVVVDDEPTWKREAVPELVALQRQQLNDLLTVPINADGDLEFFETRDTITEQWQKQRPTLAPRIKEADARYEALLEELKRRRF